VIPGELFNVISPIRVYALPKRNSDVLMIGINSGPMMFISSKIVYWPGLMPPKARVLKLLTQYGIVYTPLNGFFTRVENVEYEE